MTHFPAGGQGTGHGKITEVSRYSRIIPRANTCRHVIKVHLTLPSLAHFVSIRQISCQGSSRLLLRRRLLLWRRLLLLLLLPVANGTSSKRSGWVGRRYDFQTLTLLDRNSWMPLVAFPTAVTASALSTSTRHWAAASLSPAAILDGPGPLTTSRFRINVISTATRRPPFLPTFWQ